MRPDSRLEHGEGVARRWDGDQGDGDGVGLQGEALILELQRLRQAFEQENPDGRQPPRKRGPVRGDPRPAARQRVQVPRRRQKGKMGRAIAVCLEQFGLSGIAEARNRNDTEREQPPVPRQRGRGPIIAPDNPSLLSQITSGPDILVRDARDRPPKVRNAVPRGPAAVPPRSDRGPVAAHDDPLILYGKTPGPKASVSADRDRPPKGNEKARGPTTKPPLRDRGPVIAHDDPLILYGKTPGPKASVSADRDRPPKGDEKAREPTAMPPQRGRGPVIAEDDPSMPYGKTPGPKTSVSAERDRPPDRRNEMVREPAAVPPQRARGPIIAPDDRSLLNRTTPVPEVSEDGRDRPPNVERLRLAPPTAAGRPAAEPSVGKLVARCRDGLVAGVAFLANRDALGDNDNAPGDTMTLRAGRSYEHELRTGLRVLLAVGVLAGGWLALVPLSGAVVVPGSLMVQSNVKTIQHPTGGVVAEIPVHDGMRVNAGDLLIRLDATQAQASLQMVSKQLDEFRAKIARLVAERDDLPQPEIPAEMSARVDESSVKTLLASEASLFKARATARDSQKDILERRVTQLGEEIVGLEAQVGSKAKQLELIAGELTGVQELYDKRLVPLTRLTTLQRESARIDGERGQLISSIAETKSKIGEARLQIVKIDQDFQSDVVKDLGEAQGKEAELVERGVAARDLLDRIEIRAPTSGLIHQLVAHTIGGVIRAGDTIMQVVPDSDDLQIEARLQPNDIDQVKTNQKAFVRFPAFNQRVTPQIAGIVSYVSADTSKDAQSNASFFTVRVMLPDEERRHLAGLQLVSGMPAEVFLQTGSRTMLSYLLKPITDQLQRAFVER